MVSQLLMFADNQCSALCCGYCVGSVCMTAANVTHQGHVNSIEINREDRLGSGRCTNQVGELFSPQWMAISGPLLSQVNHEMLRENGAILDLCGCFTGRLDQLFPTRAEPTVTDSTQRGVVEIPSHSHLATVFACCRTVALLYRRV